MLIGYLTQAFNSKHRRLASPSLERSMSLCVADEPFTYDSDVLFLFPSIHYNVQSVR